MTKIPISVCIIAKNEEEYIEECLRRLKPYGFEIIVTDTGSNDSTKHIALRYADKVLDFPWMDDFSAARNFCASNASNSYILAIDCDEYVEKCNVKSLSRLAEMYPNFMGVIRIKSIVSRTDGVKSYVQDMVPRFYNREYFTYSEPIHEQITPLGIKTAANHGFLMPIELLHYGYDIPHDKMRAKQERNLKIMHKQLAENGGTPYLYYQIGQSELVLKNYYEAVKAYELGLSCGVDCGLEYVQNMIEGLASVYVMTGRKCDALYLMERYEKYCDSARYIFYHAGVLLKNGKILEALDKYMKVTMMQDADMLGNELLNCYEHIIELYNMLGKSELPDTIRRKYEECLNTRVIAHMDI